MTNVVYTQDKPNTNKSSWSETLEVVPALEIWLEQRGYVWNREVTFANRRRADVIATNEYTGEVLIVEAKSSSANPDKLVRQVLDYGILNGDPTVKLAVAIPASEARESLSLLCSQYGVGIILLDETLLQKVTTPHIVELTEESETELTVLAKRIWHLHQTNPTQFYQFAYLVTALSEQETQS